MVAPELGVIQYRAGRPHFMRHVRKTARPPSSTRLTHPRAADSSPGSRCSVSKTTATGFEKQNEYGHHMKLYKEVEQYQKAYSRET